MRRSASWTPGDRSIRPPLGDLIELLSRKVVGQPSALQYIVACIQMYQAGVNPPDRPVGIFLLPRLQVVLTTGTELSPDEAALCDRQDFPVLRKPFLAPDVLSIIRAPAAFLCGRRGNQLTRWSVTLM